MADFYPKADFGERCVPVRWQLGFLCIEASFPSCEIKCIPVAPLKRIVVKSSLKFETENLTSVPC